MIVGPPRLVATLPARSVAEARRQIEEARSAGANLAEVRIDLWTAAERAQVGALFPSSLPLMATLRSRTEGGEGPDEPGDRASLLAWLATFPFEWLDLEAARDPPVAQARSGVTAFGTIRSTHFAPGTKVSDVVRELEAPVTPGTIRKLVLPASVEVAIDDLIPVVQRLTHPHDRVLHTTGSSGPLLRALGKKLGLPLVYAALPENARSNGPRAVEPTQIPVDRLQRFFADPADPPLFAVLGHPVFHSLSPAIHDRWIVATARNGLYLPLEITSEAELRSVVARLGGLGFRGVNVTHPCKAAALTLAHESSRTAVTCDAANCLTYTRGRWEAENTDVLAITRRLEELRSERIWDGDRLTVLGAGGAGRATLYAARALGARATILARRSERAEEVARTFGAEVGAPADATPTALVVHATPAGAESASPLSLPLSRLLGPGSVPARLGLPPRRPGACGGRPDGRRTVRERRASARLSSGGQLCTLVGIAPARRSGPRRA